MADDPTRALAALRRLENDVAVNKIRLKQGTEIRTRQPESTSTLEDVRALTQRLEAADSLCHTTYIAYADWAMESGQNAQEAMNNLFKAAHKYRRMQGGDANDDAELSLKPIPQNVKDWLRGADVMNGGEAGACDTCNGTGMVLLSSIPGEGTEPCPSCSGAPASSPVQHLVYALEDIAKGAANFGRGTLSYADPASGLAQMATNALDEYYILLGGEGAVVTLAGDVRPVVKGPVPANTHRPGGGYAGNARQTEEPPASSPSPPRCQAIDEDGCRCLATEGHEGPHCTTADLP